jgi:transcriptional regulator with XRE-family HTH domain
METLKGQISDTLGTNITRKQPNEGKASNTGFGKEALSMQRKTRFLSRKPSSPRPVWSQRIFTLRTEQGWSQEELAEKVHAEAKSVRRWENGEAFPQSFYRQGLAEVFKVTQKELGFLQTLLQRNQRQNDQDVSLEKEKEEEDEADLSASPSVKETIVEETIIISELPRDSATMNEKPYDAGSTQKHAWWQPIVIICILLLIGASAAMLLYMLVIKR